MFVFARKYTYRPPVEMSAIVHGTFWPPYVVTLPLSGTNVSKQTVCWIRPVVTTPPMRVCGSKIWSFKIWKRAMLSNLGCDMIVDASVAFSSV